MFWDAESCCRANFPSDVSKCVAAAVATPEPTLAPTSVAPTTGAPVAVSKEFLSVSIPPIPIKLVNLTGPLQFEEGQRRVLEDFLINATTNEIRNELNATIQSMKLTRTNHEDGDTELSFDINTIVIITADMTYTPQDIRTSILKILDNQNSNIDLQRKNLFGLTLSFPSIQSDDGVEDSNNELTVVLASVLSVAFVLVCGGLVIIRKWKNKKLSTMQNVAVVENNQIVVVVDDNSAVDSIADESRKTLKAHETDDGYDGGNSTYSMNAAFNESDFSFPATDSSKEGDSVLGLLYYEGPDSSESEEDGHQSRAASRASRRSRRSNRSKKFTQTSAPSRKSRASATKKSRRSNRQSPLEKLDEGTEYRQSKRRDPDGFDGSTIMSGSQSRKGSTFVYRGGSLASTNGPSIAGDSLNFGTYPPLRPAAGVESVASNAETPSIVTRDPPGYDSYSRRTSKGSRRGMSDTIDAYSVSVNSSGEHTADLRNQPDEKF